MDWLEEKTGQLSLTKSLFFYMLCGITGALTAWIFTRNLCIDWLNVLLGENLRYPEGQVDIGRLDGILWSTGTSLLCRAAITIYKYSLPIYLIAASLFICWLFPRRKISVAGRIIRESVDGIAAGDFGRAVIYESGDEMGEICAGVELLRRMLVEEKNHRWQSEELQRQINAAFAHDLRTPLTVIRGYTEFLQHYLPQGRLSEEMIADRLGAMLYQEDRLLRFSETMSRLQSEEAREVLTAWVDTGLLAERIRASAAELARQYGRVSEVRLAGDREELLLDAQIVEETVDNLITNAARYAKERIFIEMVREETQLRIFVQDDGPGFSPRALRCAAEPYFSEEKKDGDHFGIGLSIGRLLCEKHGGSLQFVNSLKGGAIACASFTVGIRRVF